MSRQPCGFGNQDWARLPETTPSVGIVSILNRSTSSAWAAASTQTSSNVSWLDRRWRTCARNPSTGRQRPDDTDWKKRSLGFVAGVLLVRVVMPPPAIVAARPRSAGEERGRPGRPGGSRRFEEPG